ncbi:hypothetical protein [Leptospira sp. id769339]|uniref:hypothetical protein n=1 Tax=Leptospira sp. id769339 TaxID=2864221 RepID=UPI00214BF896|nr:hypothetical protein [Leptospira sp. id769339]MCR1795830.1 hypothetical protein [Leptospira sp. id769339]
MRFQRKLLVILTGSILCIGLLSYFANFSLRIGFQPLSDSPEDWAYFGSYIGGLLSALFGFISVVLLIYTYYASLDQRDETFIVGHLRQILILNSRMVTVYNLKHPDDHWKSDDGLALITNKTKGERGGTFAKAKDPRKIWQMLVQRESLQILYEFEQFLAALDYLIYWDLQRAEVSGSHEYSGFRSQYRNLISAYLPSIYFISIYNLTVLEINQEMFGSIPVNYASRFKYLAEFCNRVGPEISSQENGA